MVGSNSSPIIVDAILKNADVNELEVLLEAVIKNATTTDSRPKDNGNVVRSVGREGIDFGWQ